MIGNGSPVSSTIAVPNVLDIEQASMAVVDNSYSKNQETTIDVAPPLRYSVSKSP